METITPVVTLDHNIITNATVATVAPTIVVMTTEETPDATIDLTGIGLPVDPAIPVLAVIFGLVFVVLRRRE
jgi:hypothetical protein